MSTSPPFIDRASSSLDTTQIVREVIPLSKLIGLVAVVALVPLTVAVTGGIFPRLFTILAQFILAVGSAIVLMYVITRAIQLAK